MKLATFFSPSSRSPRSAHTKKGGDWGLVRRLIPYVRRNGTIFVMAIILLVPVAIVGAVQPLIIGQAISLLRQEPTWSILNGLPTREGVNVLIKILLLTIVFRLIFASIQGYLVQKVGQEITAGVRADLFNRVLSLPSPFFDRSPVGRLVTRITSDVEALGDVFSTGAIGILSDIIYILIIIVTIFALQWQLAALLVLMLIPVAALIIYFQQQYREANYQAREELSKLNSLLAENIAGINIVQLFRRERFNSEIFRSVNLKYRQEVDRTIFHDSAVSATLEWISLIAIAGVLWLGGALVLRGSLTLGTLAAFILYAQRFFDPLRRFAEKFTMFQSGFTAIERISELMDEPTEPRTSGQEEERIHLTLLQAPNPGEIRFENVSFGYKPYEYILQNLTFTIRPGEKVALVGPTGAGKSSIIRLLCRLYEPNEGEIFVDGVNIKEITQTELRRHIGVILQESFLFAGDVKRNITLGETYSFEQIKKAAAATHIEDFIEQLPKGYDTELRERGTNISGGQRQLLAFARVAIREPQILVLDEATASLDTVTERLIQEALDRMLHNRTAIIIAHRLSTIRNADRIFVLKKGRLVESGNHDELMAENGLYASLYQLQMLGVE